MWHNDTKIVIYKQPLNAPVSREEKAPVYSQTKPGLKATGLTVIGGQSSDTSVWVSLKVKVKEMMFEVLQRRCLYDVVGPPNDVLLMIVLFLFL